ncbi:ferredoxin-type protein NapF [Gallibacterium melopsittaci]|uniref:Ferredoxin-type protein NapF n=1 Tax=Gallibacterium melopsittaci TaxID=516063 RepID=A0ABV6HW58_9PAST
MDKDERYYSAYLAHNQISRRSLLRSLFTVPQSQYIEEKRRANRPPFAAKESLFLSVCTGCGECVKVCPYGLIEIQKNYPVLDLQYSACDFCKACAEVCPTHALHPAFKADTELRPQFLSSCIRQQKQVCTTCEQRCPTQAIHFVQETESLMVDAERCNGCGECKVSCFMQAIRLENYLIGS